MYFFLVHGHVSQLTGLQRDCVGGIFVTLLLYLLLFLLEPPEVILDEESCIELSNCDIILHC